MEFLAGASVTAKLEALDSFVERHADVVYRALRATEPTPTRDGKDRRPRRVLTATDKAKTWAIGMGDYIEPPAPGRVQDAVPGVARSLQRLAPGPRS